MVGAKIGEASTWTSIRPEVSLIALICAGYGKMIAKDSWRSLHRSHIACLTQLVTWGYTPSEVEQIIIDSTNQLDEYTDEPDEDTTTEHHEDGETFEDVHGEEEEMMAEELAAE